MTRQVLDLRLRENIAKNFSLKRIELEKNQTQMSNELKVTFQQIQKFEHGNNGLSAEQLLFLCQKFGWDANQFGKEPKTIENTYTFLINKKCKKNKIDLDNVGDFEKVEAVKQAVDVLMNKVRRSWQTAEMNMSKLKEKDTDVHSG